jgi:hypothetical protein
MGCDRKAKNPPESGFGGAPVQSRLMLDTLDGCLGLSAGAGGLLVSYLTAAGAMK